MGGCARACVCVYVHAHKLSRDHDHTGDISTCGCVKYQGEYQCDGVLFQSGQDPRVFLVSLQCDHTGMSI